MSSPWQFLGRIWFYLRRHGMLATVARVRLGLWRLRTCGRMVLFYCDLPKVAAISYPDIKVAHVERISSESELGAGDRLQVLNSGNPRILGRFMQERFARGATLWLLKAGDRVAGFGWTAVGATMKPHFFPLTADDVHLFDFFIFPDFRGKRLNPMLVCSILEHMSKIGHGRAYIECTAWNEAQLISLARTPFKKFGTAAKYRFFGKTIVLWDSLKSD